MGAESSTSEPTDLVPATGPSAGAGAGAGTGAGGAPTIGSSIGPYRVVRKLGTVPMASDDAYTLFMAVPTIYVKLVAKFDAAPPAERERWSRGFGPTSLELIAFQQWNDNDTKARFNSNGYAGRIAFLGLTYKF